jgi:hypothetical protein
MTNNQSEPQLGFRERMQAVGGWVLFFSQVLETSIVVFLRRGFGARYFGMQALAVIPLVLVYTLLWRGHDVGPVLWFLACYGLMLGVARFGVVRRGIGSEHSFYSGYPKVLQCRAFRGRLSEARAKSLVEPLLVLGAGALLAKANEPLGLYIMLCAGGLVVSRQLAIAYMRNRVLDMRDSYMEQREVAERFRD